MTALPNKLREINKTPWLQIYPQTNRGVTLRSYRYTVPGIYYCTIALFSVKSHTLTQSHKFHLPSPRLSRATFSFIHELGSAFPALIDFLPSKYVCIPAHNAVRFSRGSLYRSLAAAPKRRARRVQTHQPNLVAGLKLRTKPAPHEVEQSPLDSRCGRTARYFPRVYGTAVYPTRKSTTRSTQPRGTAKRESL